MLSKERIIYIVIIVVLLGILGYILFTDTTPDYVKDYEDKIELLEHEKDSILNINKDIDDKNDSLFKEIDTLNVKLTIKDNKINLLKRQTNEKVNAVDDFSDDELSKYFTERYQGFDNNIREADSTSSN